MILRSGERWENLVVFFAILCNCLTTLKRCDLGFHSLPDISNMFAINWILFPQHFSKKYCYLAIGLDVIIKFSGSSTANDSVVLSSPSVESLLTCAAVISVVQTVSVSVSVCESKNKRWLLSFQSVAQLPFLPSPSWCWVQTAMISVFKSHLRRLAQMPLVL